MADKFAGKVAVITGGSTGMGLATAKRFVQEGMDHVFITGRRKDALDRAVAEIGKNVTAVQGDVAKLADLDRLYDEVRKQNRKIDVIFANAGVAQLAPFGSCGREVLRSSLRRECERDLLHRAKGASAYERRWVDHSHRIDCRRERLPVDQRLQRHEGGDPLVRAYLDHRAEGPPHSREHHQSRAISILRFSTLGSRAKR